MQNTLTFTQNKKKYVSKPFDFEAFCLVNEAHINSDDVKRASIYRICTAAVDYMFEGTDATQDIIDELSPGARAKLCAAVWGMYAAELKNA